MDIVRNAIRSNSPYLIESDDGETWTIAGTNNSMRFLQDENAAPVAILHSRGNPGDPVLPHFHRSATDTWLVLHGGLNVWAGDQGRTLHAGDFAFVPPGPSNIHSFQITEPHTEFMGVIHPAEWISFFKAVGELYTGKGPFPSNDERHFPVPKFMKAIQDGHDVVPQPKHKLSEAQTNWSDSEIPSSPKPYYLKAHTGPRYALGGYTCSLICPTATSGGLFSINVLEAHKNVSNPVELSSFKFTKTAFSFYSFGGVWTITLDGQDVVVQSGDNLFIPAGSEFKALPKSAFARAYLFGSIGSGIEALFQAAGELCPGVIGSVESSLSDERKSKLAQAAREHEVVLSGLQA